MKPGLLVILSGVLCAANAPAVLAQTEALRARLETVLRTEKALNVPANIDRACVIDQALLAHPRISRKTEGAMAKLFVPKAKRADFARKRAELSEVFAVGAGITACNPKPAPGAKPARR